jgi:hypothetical protein
MGYCIVSRLTDKPSDPKKLDVPVKKHALCSNMVGSLLYLACWTSPDISERSLCPSRTCLVLCRRQTSLSLSPT